MANIDLSGTWIESRPPDEYTYWSNISYGNGRFVATAHDSDTPATDEHAMYSDDGINWTTGTGTAGMSLLGLAYGNGMWVATGFSLRKEDIAYSSDGATWTKIKSPRNGCLWTSVVYGDGQFVAVGGDASAEGFVMTSPNGTDWTLTVVDDPNIFTNVAYGDGMYVSCGDPTGDGNPVRYSTDGITWTEATGVPALGYWSHVAYNLSLIHI